MTRLSLILGIAALVLAGCGSGDSSPAGPDAASGKAFTKAEADKAQPKRGDVKKTPDAESGK